MIDIRHGTDSINYVRNCRPVLSISSYITVRTLTKNVNREISSCLMDRICSVTAEILDRLCFFFSIGIPEVRCSGIRETISVFREPDIVKLDLVKAHFLYRGDCQFHIIFPCFSGISGRPAGILAILQNTFTRIVICKETVIKDYNTADRPEAGIFCFLNACFVVSVVMISSFIRRRSIAVCNFCMVCQSPVFDIDNHSIRVCFSAAVNIIIHRIDASCIQVISTAFRRHHTG